MKKLNQAETEIKNATSLTDAINIKDKHTAVYPERPQKPYLKPYATSKEVLEYAKRLKIYENVMPEYTQNLTKVKSFNAKLHSFVEEYLKEESELNNIPEKYRDKVFGMAYRLGHSSGIKEVNNYLEELLEIFD